MEIIVKHFDELTTRELYEILKTKLSDLQVSELYNEHMTKKSD